MLTTLVAFFLFILILIKGKFAPRTLFELEQVFSHRGLDLNLHLN